MTSPRLARLLAPLLSVAVVASASAQRPDSSRMAQHRDSITSMGGMTRGDMKGMKGMKGMMGAPHHNLAMAYRQNIVSFARTLRSDLKSSNAVNVDLARPAAAEMRRSYDQMKVHHAAHVSTMGSADQAMAAQMKVMDTHLTALGEHLTALESELGAATPNAATVTTHVDGILKESSGMPAMRMGDKAHKMN